MLEAVKDYYGKTLQTSADGEARPVVSFLAVRSASADRAARPHSQ